jgi:hypothetical protein
VKNVTPDIICIVEDIQKENRVLYTTGIKLNHVSVKYVTSLKIMLTPPDAIILAISRDACLVFFYNLFRRCITSQNGLNPYIYISHVYVLLYIHLPTTYILRCKRAIYT